MSCYCKEVPLDQKGKIEEERPRNLFEDDDDGVDYSEGYMQELINTIHLEKHSSICGSTPSLPDVAVGTDRCESKLEIPWLKISLAPPGYYEIKKQEGRPKKVLCDCWNLSANDDVYSEPVVQEVEEPKCKCASKAVDNPKSDEGPKKSEVTFEHNMSETDENQKGKIEEGEMEEEIIGQDEIGDNKIGKEPSLQKPASKIKTKSQTEQDTVDAPQNEPSEINRKKENEKSATSTQEKSAQKLTKKESKKSAGSVEENPSAISTQEKSAQKLTKTESKNSVTSVEEKPSATSTQEKSSQKLTRKESKKSATSIEEKPSATSAQERSKQKLTKKESKKSATSVQEEEALLEEKDNDCPSSSSSSSSLPSDCICLAQKECEDILGQPTAFVFDNPCFAQHEGYMDPIYKLFPDDCDTYCGPHIEMPWSDLTIPRKIKLRQAKKKVEPESSSKCPCKPPEEVEPKTPPKCPCKPPEDVEPKSSSKSPSKPPEEVVCGKKEDTTVLTEPQVTPASDNPESPVEKIDKSFEIQLSFTEIISNMAALENKCEPSGVSVSIRPSSKERSSCSEPRPSSYSCRCSSPRSKQNSPTLKNRTSKSKNTNCKCPSRDVSFAKLESDTSHGSRCKNASCKPSSPNGKSSRRTSDQAKPIQKSSYQDPVMNVLETCEAEMEPLRDTLNQLKCKIRNLNIPELNNWNNNPMQCPPCCTSRPVTSPTLQQQSSLMNRTSGMPVPHSMPAPPSMQPPPQNFPSMQLAPPCMQAPSQNFPPMQRPPQFPFPPMFPPMTPLPPPGMPPQGMPPKGMPPKGMPPQGMPPRRCCPQCACKEIRSRRRSPRSASSSTEFSEYDSLSDEGSGCPFLRALSSSKNIYKDRESRTQRKCRDRDDKRKADRPSKKCPNCTAKKYNKRSQIEYSRQDICTDTEPEIQVHYGPKRPKMKTKHVFKGVVDKTNMNMAKNQRLRIAVRLSPSGEEVIDDNYLAIQGPCEYK